MKKLSGRMIRFPLRTWDQSDSKRNFIKLTRYLIHEKLNWGRDDFCNNFCLDIISKYRLNGGFGRLYSRNIYPMVVDCFPEWKIKAWEMRKSRVPEGFWTRAVAVEATKWLVEERLQWDLDKVSREISNSFFHDNNLGGMLRKRKAGAVQMIVEAYPEYDWTYLKDRDGYRITPEQAKEIRGLYNKGYNQREISRMYKCDPVTVFNIVHGKAFKIL